MKRFIVLSYFGCNVFIYAKCVNWATVTFTNLHVLINKVKFDQKRSVVGGLTLGSGARGSIKRELQENDC